MNFDPKWPHGHVTRDGRKARVICSDAKNTEPVIALVTTADGAAEWSSLWSANGSYYPNGSHSNHDLFNAPAPTVRAHGWVNIYPEGFAYGDIGGAKTAMTGIYSTRKAADEYADSDRIACVHIDREVEEGEGL